MMPLLWSYPALSPLMMPRRDGSPTAATVAAVMAEKLRIMLGGTEYA